MSQGVSEAIARLARGRCINAISCMAAMPRWAEDARLLDGIEKVDCGSAGRVQVGLHLVLASERPLGPMSCTLPDGKLPGPDRMLVLTLLGKVDMDEVVAEIDRQFDAFVAARGMAPDFVDAHQHVHLYPGIRKAVIDATRRHAPEAWVRVPEDSLPAMLLRPWRGKAIGSAIHSLGFRSQLRRAGLRANRSFAGHYDFSGPYRNQLGTFLRYGSGAHLVMCHPGAGEAEGDTLAAARQTEADVIGELPLEFRLRSLGPDSWPEPCHA
ncbi:ChbG/HpnK family deacetylase [Novosphingobium flavum]|uniref:ChbG/HpnK family deacetylase n=2 Tax=Novosphingobium flavum TaxID=1778672 RepID=A0A7X1KK08_9SPHN|nr:ChbG/HpnK family deacetylase [Novosphingobium flavum]